MLNDTQVTIIGRVGQTPEARITGGGRSVTSFDVAVARRGKDRETGQWRDTGTTWYRVNCWGDMAENTAATVTKGMRVIVIGALSSRPWRNETKEGITWEIRADGIGPDLAFATADVRQITRNGPPDPSEPAAEA
jgi:single-strand DNA-binding protein